MSRRIRVFFRIVPSYTATRSVIEDSIEVGKLGIPPSSRVSHIYFLFSTRFSFQQFYAKVESRMSLLLEDTDYSGNSDPGRFAIIARTRK